MVDPLGGIWKLSKQQCQEKFEENYVEHNNRYIEVKDRNHALAAVEGVHYLVPSVSDKILKHRYECVLQVVHVNQWRLSGFNDVVVRVQMHSVGEEL